MFTVNHYFIIFVVSFLLFNMKKEEKNDLHADYFVDIHFEFNVKQIHIDTSSAQHMNRMSRYNIDYS